MDLSIDIIKQKFFPSVPVYNSSSINVTGWTVSPQELTSFVEPPLVVSNENNLHNSKIWLISAPGAVGKTTFAKQLARKTGAIFVDLARADTIGTHYVTGSLFRANLTDYISKKKVALLLDGLDEAFLRVTFESRMHFFDDIINITQNTDFPILIFGRPASIDESQLILEDKHITPAIISIDYFTHEDAIRLVQNMVTQKLSKDNNNLPENFSRHQVLMKDTIDNILKNLNQTANISDKNFSGYAPVLDAVAEFVCRCTNFSQVNNFSVEQIYKESILEEICRYILEREQKKLTQQLSFSEDEKKELYNPLEQMRALCHVYAGHQVKDLCFNDVHLSDKKMQDYMQSVQEFIVQHPFLIDGKNATNEVFSGAMQSFILKQKSTNEMDAFLHHAVSPLLAEFYFKDDNLYTNLKQKKINNDIKLVEIEHIPFLLSSYEALSSQNKKISLDITEAEDVGYVDISIARYDNVNEKEEELQHIRAKSDGKIIFKQHIAALAITCPTMEVEFRSNDTFCVTLPLDINVKKLSFFCSELQFVGGGSAIITADECYSEVSKINTFGAIEIYANWPGSRSYPWSIALPIERNEDEKHQDDLHIAFFSFCKLIRSFRSHSKGRLARFEDKINHSRMSKNFGEEIKNYLMESEVISHNAESHMYYLDPNRLFEVTGASYQQVIQRNLPKELYDILRYIVNN